jgi:dTDP-4-amino-4,6-dideoxygalactose transaminase
LTLDPDAVRRQITPQTRAILAVDMMGNPCDGEALRQVADEYGLWYVADAAQSLGAYRQGQPASTQADALVVSFTVGKSLFAGEGGAILTDHAELYQKLVWWTQHPDRQRRDIGFNLTNQFGLNGRIHPLAAVVANATFDAALAQLCQRQAWGMAVLDGLNDLGLTQPTTFREEGILPTFFRLCVPWRGEAQEQVVMTACAEWGYAVEVNTGEIPWLPTDPAWVAQYDHLSAGWQIKMPNPNQYCFVAAK